MSKNAITIDQITLSCRHVVEMMAADITENFAIRILEHFTDVYSKIYTGGSATPHYAHKVELWSLKALKVREACPDAKPKDHYRVEHGTPKRAFARKVLELYYEGELEQGTLNALVEQHWKLAVITIEEDRHLNKVARSKMYNSPEDRWADAGIYFP